MIRRAFLDEVCTDIVEITASKTLKYFPGNYSEWENNAEEMETFQKHREEKQQKAQDHINKSIQSSKQRGDLQAVRNLHKKVTDI